MQKNPRPHTPPLNLLIPPKKEFLRLLQRQGRGPSRPVGGRTGNSVIEPRFSHALIRGAGSNVADWKLKARNFLRPTLQTKPSPLELLLKIVRLIHLTHEMRCLWHRIWFRRRFR